MAAHQQLTSIPLRESCPAGVCNCEREKLAKDPSADIRVLLLTRHEEERLIQRLQHIKSLEDLRHMQQRIFEQLGINLLIDVGNSEVRTAKGIQIWIDERPGLCNKVRKSIPKAVRIGLQNTPEIIYALLNEQGLFGFNN